MSVVIVCRCGEEIELSVTKGAERILGVKFRCACGKVQTWRNKPQRVLLKDPAIIERNYQICEDYIKSELPDMHVRRWIADKYGMSKSYIGIILNTMNAHEKRQEWRNSDERLRRKISQAIAGRRD